MIARQFFRKHFYIHIIIISVHFLFIRKVVERKDTFYRLRSGFLLARDHVACSKDERLYEKIPIPTAAFVGISIQLHRLGWSSMNRDIGSGVRCTGEWPLLIKVGLWIDLALLHSRWFLCCWPAINPSFSTPPKLSSWPYFEPVGCSHSHSTM